ncbi:hypothetical protein ACWF94_27410, partial [Streptomyces sp. NPDC055078]
MNATTPPYPPARTVGVFEDVAGVRVPDPYRWLEPETGEVRRWQRRQAEIATAVCYDGQDPAAVRKLIETYDRGSRPALPGYAAGRWYRAVTGPDGVAPTVVVADRPFGAGRTVVDLAAFGSARNPAVLSWLVPSPDGRVLALGVCTDGSEHNTIRLIEVESGRVLDGVPRQVLHSAWAGGVSWLPDSSGFYFLALTGSPREFRQAVFRHRLALPSRDGGGAGTTEVEPIPVGEGSREYTLVQLSPDGRWAVASHRVGSPVPVAVRDLSRPGSAWRPFVTECAGTVAGHIVGDHYIAVTDVAAPRGRVVALPLDSGDPGDPAGWTELVPEGGTVLRSLTPVGDHLYL